MSHGINLACVGKYVKEILSSKLPIKKYIYLTFHLLLCILQCANHRGLTSLVLGHFLYMLKQSNQCSRWSVLSKQQLLWTWTNRSIVWGMVQECKAVCQLTNTMYEVGTKWTQYFNQFKKKIVSNSQSALTYNIITIHIVLNIKKWCPPITDALTI